MATNQDQPAPDNPRVQRSLSPSWRARLSQSESSYGPQVGEAELSELHERRAQSASTRPVISIDGASTSTPNDNTLPADKAPIPFTPAQPARASRRHRQARRITDRDVMTESASVRGADLNAWDVAALIINKMIGAGIFTTPGLVLQLTQNKASSIGLWIAGGAYAFIR